MTDAEIAELREIYRLEDVASVTSPGTVAVRVPYGRDIHRLLSTIERLQGSADALRRGIERLGEM